VYRGGEQFHSLIYQAAANEFHSQTLDRLHALSLRLWHLALDRLGDVTPRDQTTRPDRRSAAAAAQGAPSSPSSNVFWAFK